MLQPVLHRLKHHAINHVPDGNNQNHDGDYCRSCRSALGFIIIYFWVARFSLLIGGEFVLTSAAMALFMIGGDRLFQWMGAATPIRSTADVLLATPVVAAGLWIAVKRMSGRDPLDQSQSGCANR